jgi:tetratricopeptide (TPR) repeat protein
MGVVYRACDRTTGRVVALKVLKPDAADGRARERFVREIRAAARVEHDHVVRVYATSDAADPVLYFAMEYLAGPSLAGRLRERARLGPREAAGVIAQVAGGLAAAHAACLVHRDVKPDNILFDPVTSRAKIGDFGLARLAAEPSNLTRDGVVAGTPAYLSPEQARGDHDVGPLADVYALGVTLYECLAGEAPFRGSPHVVVQQILNDEPRTPRALNDAVPRDLETVCLKAMAKEPHRRYASAAEMGDDLDRWLRGKPVLARPSGLAGQLWRLGRRKPLAGALLTTLAIVLVVSSVAVLSLWRRAEASAARARADFANAERNYRQAREAVDKLYVKLYVDGTIRAPGLESVRKDVNREILRYYDEFLRQRGNDPALRADAAEASFRVGLLNTEMGDKRDALTALEHASGLFEVIARENPGDLANRRKLAKCHDQIGYMLQQLGRVPEALDAYRRACDVYRGLVAAGPEDPQWRRLLGHGLGNLANTISLSGNKAEARRTYGQAREQQDALMRLDPANTGYRTDLAMTLNNMSLVAEPAEALDLLREALALRRALVTEKPQAAYLKQNVARTLTNLAVVYSHFGRHTDALSLAVESCAVLRLASNQDPAYMGLRRELAEAELTLAATFAQLGRPEEALLPLNEGLDRLNELLKSDPENAVFKLCIVCGYTTLAHVQESRGQLEEALRARQARLDLLQQLVRVWPKRADIITGLEEEPKAIKKLLARIGR